MWIFEGDLSWDDWTIFIVAAIAVGMGAIIHYDTRHGLGQNIWNVDIDTVTHLLFYIYIGGFFYLPVTCGAKISILLLYVRIFDSAASERHRFRNICWALIALITATTLGCIVSWVLECEPLNLIWTRWTYSPTESYKGHCANAEIQVYTFAALNMVYDLVVFCLPIHRVLKMRSQSTRRKVTIILTFLVGLFVTTCSAVRLQYLVNFGTPKDPTFQYAHMCMVSMFECYFGIICACMPLIAGSVRRMFATKVNAVLRSRSSDWSSGPLVLPPMATTGPERAVIAHAVSDGEGFIDYAKRQDSVVPALQPV
ncbi:Hypothetical predicted protein [Lecanosticta acicola]|uniref:Rhodopsin domain-containing protein n=1 Tax=Lecanosticta acicola TaxID=111012 RepID=A0AAI8YXX9_9PEZI|nr:Hypothetical predicted protein [Lecanosticta acicola]